MVPTVNKSLNEPRANIYLDLLPQFGEMNVFHCDSIEADNDSCDIRLENYEIYCQSVKS